MTRKRTASESRCLVEERDRLPDEIRQCDFCFTSVEEHRRCYEDTARSSGERSKGCFS